MSYFIPFINETGIHVNTYEDILADLIDQVKNIYGQDLYLDNDGLDYQFLSIQARQKYDTEQLAVYVYNSRSLATATGVALDSIVKINGLQRQTPSYSTCQVVITGVYGTVISNGIVTDISGYKWDLPAIITIPIAGSIAITVECETLGAISALPGDITIISTPTQGWISVNNLVAAVEGTPVESDSELRLRQTLSVALPSQTLLEGVGGGIASVSGVLRHKEYENDTNAPDTNGFPEHSITCVVEGGTDANIAEQIYLRKGIGCYTNGDVAVDYTDNYNNITTIRFYRPSYITIIVEIDITQLTGYTVDMITSIKEALVDFINNYDIGNDVIWSSFWYEIQSIITDMKNPPFKITAINISTGGSPLGSPGTVDIDISALEVAYAELTDITVNVT